MTGRRTPDVPSIRRAVLSWYRRFGRDLPWRRTRNPYRILVSEMMLQQTQVSRVLPKYRQFLRVFPTIVSLARATPGAVVREWQGLGYNRRALWLHRTTRRISIELNGRFPRTYDQLRTLPGIGDYTARALMVFAFDYQETALDVNVRRVLSRIIARSPVSITEETARTLLPPRQAFAWNQALMDIGALFCTARNPECSSCPVQQCCLSAGRVNTPGTALSRKEPSRHGVPRRIYRGRILKTLSERTSLTGRKLAGHIGLAGTDRDLRWLRGIVGRLDEEGLLHLVSRRSDWSVRRLS